ncbi:MAG: Ca-activated chloride channel family protein [Phycisphaerales bacterium]|jgi:Ca-activated chloride channel family protein
MNARRFKAITLAALIAGSTISIGAAHAQVEIDRPPVQVIVPQRGWNQSQAVSVSSIAATIKIKDRVATTELAITLSNAARRPLEAQLMLPVPSGSAIKKFGLDGLNEGTAELMTAEQAKMIYRDIVRKMIDPGLLEFVGTALVKSSVFPVPAGGSQVFRVTYEEVLPFYNGRLDYALPKSEALGAAGAAWSIDMTIESGQGLGPVFSPTHGVTSELDSDGRLSVRVANAGAPGAFRLSAMMDQGDGMACLLYPDARVADGKGGYFMLVVDAPKPAKGAVAIKRELTLVIDRSGSMANGKLEQAVAAAKQVIGGLAMGESFNIIDYADEVEQFRAEPIAKDAQTAKAAIAYLDSLVARGGTNLHDALLASLRQPATEGTLPMVLFMTDGLATVGVTDEATIRQSTNTLNASERRVFTFGVGNDVNAPLLSGIAEESRAAATYILPGEDVEVKVGQVFARLDGPVITDVQFSPYPRITGRLPVQARLVMPSSLPDLFDGDQIVIFGQYMTNAEMTFRLNGTGADGKPWETSIKVDPDNARVSNSTVPRLWAQKRIASLLSEIRKSAAGGSETNPELEDEIVRLSLEHGILSEYTSFIAAAEEDLGRYRKKDEGGRYSYDLGAMNRRDLNDDRSGERAVQKQLALDSVNSPQAAPASVDPRGGIFNAERRSQTSFSSIGGNIEAESFERVKQVADRTLIRRGEQWVDSRILEDDEANPEGLIKPVREIAFDSDEYWELLETLVKSHRQGLLATAGELVLLIDGEQVLVHNSAPESEDGAEAEADPDD